MIFSGNNKTIRNRVLKWVFSMIKNIEKCTSKSYNCIWGSNKRNYLLDSIFSSAITFLSRTNVREISPSIRLTLRLDNISLQNLLKCLDVENFRIGCKILKNPFLADLQSDSTVIKWYRLNKISARAKSRRTTIMCIPRINHVL